MEKINLLVCFSLVVFLLFFVFTTGLCLSQKTEVKSKKVENLFFTGQLSVPGPGVPPSLISGKITAELIQKIKV